MTHSSFTSLKNPSSAHPSLDSSKHPALLPSSVLSSHSSSSSSFLIPPSAEPFRSGGLHFPSCLRSPSPLLGWAVSLSPPYCWLGGIHPPPPFLVGRSPFTFLVGRSPLPLLGLGGLPSTFWLGGLPSPFLVAPLPPCWLGNPSPPVGGLPPWLFGQSPGRGWGEVPPPPPPLPLGLGGLHFPSCLPPLPFWLEGLHSLCCLRSPCPLLGWAVPSRPSWLTAEITRARDTPWPRREERPKKGRGDRNQYGRGTSPLQRSKNKKKKIF